MKITAAIVSSLLAVSAAAFDKNQRKSNPIPTTRPETHQSTP
jgi:hypothetical protein